MHGLVFITYYRLAGDVVVRLAASSPYNLGEFCRLDEPSSLPFLRNFAHDTLQVTCMSTATRPLKSNGEQFYAWVRIRGSGTTITSSPVSVSGTQSSFSSSVPLASLFGCLLLNYRLRRTRKTSCLLALYLQTKKREGRPVSEAVSHFVYWHDGRSCAVPAGDFGRPKVWPCIVQRNCKWMHEIEKNNGKSGSCLLQFWGK